MEIGKRGWNNQKWQGLKEKEKMDMKTFVAAEIKGKEMGGDKHYWRKGVERQTNTKWERNEWLY